MEKTIGISASPSKDSESLSYYSSEVPFVSVRIKMEHKDIFSREILSLNPPASI